MNALPTDLDTLCRLSAAAVRGDLERATALSRDVAEPGTGLSERAERHRLAGFLFATLHRSPAWDCLPDRLRAAFRSYYIRQWTTNERLADEMERLAPILAACGEEVLWIKGPLLAERLFGGLDTRSISDLDLLVRRPSATRRVEAALAGAGYVRRSSLAMGRRLSRRFTHHLEFARGEQVVELHWTLQRHPSLRLDPVDVFAASRCVNLAGRAHRAAGLEHELLAQMVALPADLQIGKLLLRTPLEIWALARVQRLGADGWPGFLARREFEGSRRLSVAALGAALRLFGTPDELAPLAAALAPERRASDEAAIVSAFTGAPGRFAQPGKLAAFRLYESGLPASAVWWAVSLPARLLVYRSESRRRLPWT